MLWIFNNLLNVIIKNNIFIVMYDLLLLFTLFVINYLFQNLSALKKALLQFSEVAVFLSWVMN